MSLSKKEKMRYSRHFNLPDFGEQSQIMLKNASVLVVGAGGLGCPVLQYLTAAGIGQIGVMDYDTVEISNLQRQVLFDENDVGKLKCSVAVSRLSKQNSNVTFVEYQERLTSENALEIFEKYDVIVDGTDNLPTRYLINDAAVITGKPFVYGSIYRYEGQVSVFNHRHGPTYRDMFPSPPPPELVTNCADGGVIGVLPGIVGNLQAMEVVKILTGIGDVLSGKLLLFDALSASTMLINIGEKTDRQEVTQLIDYEIFCDVSVIKGVEVGQLARWFEVEENLIVIDVREKLEYDYGHIRSINIPLSAFESFDFSFPKNQKLIVCCKSGARSTKALKLLKEKFGYTDVMNLMGGLLEWKLRIDSELQVL